MAIKRAVLDYRGKRDLSVTEEIRKLLLDKNAEFAEVEVLVDTEKFAKKIEVFAGVTGCGSWRKEKENHWSVIVTPPSCRGVAKVIWK